MPARADWHWTQIFGFFQGDVERIHSSAWETAWRSVDADLKSRMDAQGLSQLNAMYEERSNIPSEKILYQGSGWGALELERRVGRDEPKVPSSFVFVKDSLGVEQKKWLTLLSDGILPEQSTSEIPGDWMVQCEWREMLETSVSAAPNWYAWLHLGVMRLENFDAEGAKAAWKTSVEINPSAWAWRNLVALARMENDDVEALACLRRAWDLNHRVLELAQEYLQILNHAKHFDEARAVYDSLPEHFKINDRIQILRGRIALELDDLGTVEQVMQCEYAVVREGDTELTDIWFEMWYRRMASASQRELTEDDKAEIRKLYPPAARIDFRSIAK
jgi:tetratricopeptide (TPR) repeat protein